MSTEIRTPNCPKCGSSPALTFATPYFCTNDECDVLHWPPDKTVEEILAGPQETIDLPWEEQVVYAIGEIVAVRAHYLDYTGVSIKVEKQWGMPFTFPGDIAICTVDRDAEYQPRQGDRVKITVGPGIVVEPYVEGATDAND